MKTRKRNTTWYSWNQRDIQELMAAQLYQETGVACNPEDIKRVEVLGANGQIVNFAYSLNNDG